MTLRHSPLDPAVARLSRTIGAGEYWLETIRTGESLRIVDVEGNQSADTLFFSAADRAERYSATDTMRENGNVYLGLGSRLYSTEGRIMLEITADLVGRHDTLGGACSSESNTVRYGHETRTMHACRDSYMLAIAEHDELGITKRDITHNVNFFMNVPVTEDGRLTFAQGLSAPGKYVEIQARMDLIVLISNCPQLNNPCNGFNPTPIDVHVWGGPSDNHAR